MSDLPVKPSSPEMGFAGTTGDSLVEVGQWYWVKDSRNWWDQTKGQRVEEEYRWLGCVMHIGSNYLELQAPASSRSTHVRRVHFNDFWRTLQREHEAEAVIAGKVAEFQNQAAAHLTEIKELTARLGISNQAALTAPRAETEGRSLMVMSSQSDVKRYEQSLILARKEQLPELFKAVEEANGEMVRWMSASSMPLLAAAQGMKTVLGEVEDRIFNVSLYAGLAENVVQCSSGEPAPFAEKLHVMQRRLYMDEECLLNYRHGGMDFKNIGQFDAWVSEPVKRDRILPHPRCLVAMRVRREKKDREWDGSIEGALINFELGAADKFTYLYIRNGDRVYRISTELEFDETIIPARSEFDPAEPLMVKLFGNRLDKLVKYGEYEALKNEWEAGSARRSQWIEENPQATWDSKSKGPWGRAMPYWPGEHSFNPRDWEPFNADSVYFDDASDEIKDRIKKYNRIAVIIQGLFDRSDVLHPHPPVQIWKPQGFAQAITLVYDGSDVLHQGDTPDFEAYRQQCNASLDANSVVIGQELAWLQHEAAKENKRRDADWRIKNVKYVDTFKPYGNPGPGYLARMAKFRPKAGQATFTWHRERQSQGNYGGARWGDPILTTITVPVTLLFNVSAYKPGDYKRFFQDPRSRAKYLQWASLLLTAEEFHAGNVKAQDPV